MSSKATGAVHRLRRPNCRLVRKTAVTHMPFLQTKNFLAVAWLETLDGEQVGMKKIFCTNIGWDFPKIKIFQNRVFPKKNTYYFPRSFHFPWFLFGLYVILSAQSLPEGYFAFPNETPCHRSNICPTHHRRPIQRPPPLHAIQSNRLPNRARTNSQDAGNRIIVLWAATKIFRFQRNGLSIFKVCSKKNMQLKERRIIQKTTNQAWSIVRLFAKAPSGTILLSFRTQSSWLQGSQ